MTTKPRQPIHQARNVPASGSPVPVAAKSAPPNPDVAKSATSDLEALINRAYNRPLTQEERAFLASVRERIEADPKLGLSAFDARWLAELADR